MWIKDSLKDFFSYDLVVGICHFPNRCAQSVSAYMSIQAKRALAVLLYMTGQERSKLRKWSGYQGMRWII